MIDPARTVQMFEEMDQLLAQRWQRIKELEAELSTASSKLEQTLAAGEEYYSQLMEERKLRHSLESRLDAVRAFCEKHAQACGEILALLGVVKVGTFPSEPHPDVKRWPLGPVQIYPDVESQWPEKDERNVLDYVWKLPE